jgi:hypothetical protein
MQITSPERRPPLVPVASEEEEEAMTYFYFFLCHLLADLSQSKAMRLGKVSDSFLLAEHFSIHFLWLLLAGLGCGMGFGATVGAAFLIAGVHVFHDRLFWPCFRAHRWLPNQGAVYRALVVDQAMHLGWIYLVIRLLKAYAFLI